MGSLGEWRESLLAFDAELKERQQAMIVFITAARVGRSLTGLTGGVVLPAFDGQSPRLHQLTVGFAYALCTKRLY